MSQEMKSPMIRERMEVVDAQGVHVGIVDHVLGDYIQLTKEHAGDATHRTVSREYVGDVDDKVHLTRSLKDLVP